MSYYDDERPRRHRSTRDRARDDYDESTVYNSRDNVRTTTLIKRRDDSPDSVEEVRRDFSPPDGRGGYVRETTIRKSGTRPARPRSYEDDRYYDDRYDDRSRAGGKRDSYYASRDSRRSDDRRDRRSKYHDSSDSSRSRSRTPPRKERRKSMPEEALEALGLGGVAAAVLGKKKSRSRSRDRDRARSRSRGGRRGSSSSGHRGKSRSREQLTQALKAAVLAGAGEAFRARKEPGGWGGEKGKRVLTAAFSAGGVDGLINTGKEPGEHGGLTTLGSAVTGIAASRIVNGPRSKSRGRPGSPDRYGSRSRSHGIGDAAAGGTIAVAAKKAYDSIRGRSKSREDSGRGRGRSRSSSYDSYYDGRSPPRTKRSRSRSVAARGLAKLGLTDAADKVDPARRNGGGNGRYPDEYNDDRSRSTGYGYDDVGQPRSGPNGGKGRSRSVGPTQGPTSPPPGGYRLDYGPHHYGDPETDSDSDLGSSTDEETELKKGRRRQLVGAGLATVATIHAGHSLYTSAEKRRARIHAVREGKISKEEAIKNRNRDRLQDVASVGLAALGVKGAYSEWKEMKEGREELHEKKETIERHAAKREARRRKLKALGQQGYIDTGYSNSTPDLHSRHGGSQYYNGSGPYSATYSPDPAAMRQHNSQPQWQPHYYDDNPYAYANGNQQQPPPPHNDTGIPPPPVGQPSR